MVRRPSIPDHELASRPAALGRALAEAGFDGWIAFGDDRAVAGADHVRFLADFEPHFEPVLLAGRTSDPKALMLTGPESVGYASLVTQRAAIEAVIAIEEFVHPDEEYPTISMISGLNRLRGLFEGTRRIALLGGGAVPFSVWQRALAP